MVAVLPPQPWDTRACWPGTARSFHYAPAFQVKTLDTTGAGDIFHAGFIYGLLQGWPLARQLDFACAAAALNCTAAGRPGRDSVGAGHRKASCQRRSNRLCIRCFDLKYVQRIAHDMHRSVRGTKIRIEVN